MKVAPSILSADFTRLYDEIMRVEDADYIHVDVMDGRFVPNITIGIPVVEKLSERISMPMDVHLMIVEPEKYTERFVRAGASIVTVHAEATPHLHRAVQQIKQAGARAGVALNPSTPLEAVRYVISDIDLLLIMTVNPGFGGQRFIPAMWDKIRTARELLDSTGSSAILEVDGGVSPDNVGRLASLGVDMVVAGSAVFGSDDPGMTVRLMQLARQM